MDLDNPIKVVVHHLLIGGMTCLGHWDEFLMVSVCDEQWTRPMVNHDARLTTVMIHQATILYRLSTLREY